MIIKINNKLLKAPTQARAIAIIKLNKLNKVQTLSLIICPVDFDIFSVASFFSPFSF